MTPPEGPSSETRLPGGRLKAKTALITGAAQGIGAAIARRFAGEGALVFIADLETQREAGKTLVEKITAAGGRAGFIPLDVTHEESWIAALALVEEQGGPDILVNNAGINIREPIETMRVESLDAMLAVNVKGPFLGCKHAIPALRRRGGGVIINMSSVCGLIGHRYTTEAYTVTKGALTLLTKSVAVRYAKDNIRCNSLHPSTVDTPLVQELFKDPARKAERLGEVPLGRLATAEDVAAAALFLASDEAAFINGAALPVDGGATAD
jgi:NAD(P)-dependent dehydrogenase (short-subunit alcohol dehydrogenase family)